jgi:voltage-gated potassium channel
MDSVTGSAGWDATGADPPARRRPVPWLYQGTYLGVATASVGFVVMVLGFLSAAYPTSEIYPDALSGFDPPFDVIAGILLIALSIRIRERRAVAWLFSLIAPALTIFIGVASPNAFSISAAVGTTALVTLIYPYRAGFYRGVATGPEATQLMVVVAALLTMLFGTVGARRLGNQFAPSPGIRGWVEAVYFTVSTISTNGSNYTPITEDARWFTIALILLGVGTFLSAVVVLFLPFLERRLERIAARLERAQMEDLSGHVIVCGVSAEARATVESLRGAGVRAVILSTDSNALELLKAEGYRSLAGEPSSEEALRAVGIERARALVAADPSDAENLLTVITARGLVPSLRIVAIAASPQTLAKLRRAGANEAISVVTEAARLLTSAALTPAGGNGPRVGARSSS